MININQIRPGQIATWRYVSSKPELLLKGGRENANPFYGRVEKHATMTGQAASHAMYENAAKKVNPAWQSSDRAPRFETTDNPVVVKSAANGRKQVRILNPRTVQTTWYVDGQPAAPEQVAIIESFLPKRSESSGVKIAFPYEENLINIMD